VRLSIQDQSIDQQALTPHHELKHPGTSDQMHAVKRNLHQILAGFTLARLPSLFRKQHMMAYLDQCLLVYCASCHVIMHIVASQVATWEIHKILASFLRPRVGEEAVLTEPDLVLG
jgi:hypothetical protein